jgi:serine/threonine protein kinase
MTPVRLPKAAVSVSQSSARRVRSSRLRLRPTKLAPGVLVGGRFRVCRKIATGGMGEVWAGEHCATGMRVALKVLLPEASRSPEVVQRFTREAVLLGRLRSDRVARVIDFLVDPGCGAVLVTEFVEGRSLADAVGSTRLSVEAAVELGVEIARAVRELHRAHIVHRDLKPGNVILQPLEDGRSRAVLVDLGVSRLISQGDEETSDGLTDITKTHIVLGTIGYMAPEQILSAHEVTASADLYALGAILFRMVAGRSVFGEASQAQQLRAKLQGPAPRLETGRADRVARRFEAVVSRALESEPAARYATADEMIADLSAVRDGAQVTTATTRGRRPRARGRQGAWRTTLTAIVAIALTACGAAGAMFRARTPPPASALGATTEPAPQALMSMNGNGLESSGEREVYGPSEAVRSQVSVPPRDRAAASARRLTEVSTQRARDVELMRAIERAVAEESYATLAVPSPDAVPVDWRSRRAPPNPALAARR